MDLIKRKNLSKVWLVLLATLLFFSPLLADRAERIIKDGNTLYERETPYNVNRSYELFLEAYDLAKKNNSNYQIYQSLSGIIKSGRKIGKDISSYEKRFAMLSLPKFKNLTTTNNKLVIRFDRDMQKSYYRYFRINSKKLVVDIYGDYPHKTRRITDKFIKRVTIANYQKALIRVVLETEDDDRFDIDVWKNAIIFQVKRTDKTSTTPKKVAPPKPVITKPVRSAEEKQINENINKFISTEKKTVVIDAGHGGRDSGAVGVKGVKEKHIVLKISKMFASELRKRGYRVYMTRDNDKFIKLQNRTKFANKKSAHLFISIHANSVPVKKSVHGVETYFLSTARTARAKRVAEKENAVDLKAMESMSKLTFLNFLNREKIVSSNKLAIDLQKGILDSLRTKYSGVRDGGVREGPFWVLVGAQMPAVLVEVGFVSNSREAYRLQNSHYQGLIADGLADGVDRFFLNNIGK